MAFNALDQSLDIAWLVEHGWTIPGNLAFRHILSDFNQFGGVSEERIQEIVLQYDCDEPQIQKIKETLAETVDLVRELRQIFDGAGEL